MKKPRFRLSGKQQDMLLSLVLHPNITTKHVLNIRDILRTDDPLQAEKYISYLSKRLGASRRFFHRFPQLNP